MIEKENIFEASFWIALLAFCVVVAMVLIYQGFTDYGDNPTETTIDSFQVPISEVQFPTITICPQLQHLIDAYQRVKARYRA